MTSWAITAEPGQEPQAKKVARRSDRPLVPPDETRFPFLLACTAQGLELRQVGADAPGPLRIDFGGGRMRQRIRTSGIRSPLPRALGLKPGHRPVVVDATAGLGQDGFLLATLGCRVTLVERALPLYLLLDEALQRALADPAIAETAGRVTLIHADAATWLEKASPVEALYLDPMYPARRRHALSGKGMQMLQRLVGKDEDAGVLLSVARRSCSGRVVVKRPMRAGPLAGQTPDFSVKGGKTRFDVYLGNFDATINARSATGSSSPPSGASSR